MSFITSLTRSWLTRSFRAFRFTNANDSSLPYQDTENLGLYIHIPFCRSLCDVTVKPPGILMYYKINDRQAPICGT